ncbi:amidase [Variovorax dokdonensis]|uniref:Amidase n=1 Tax=Variovorax dokdonensis TaxID=344883 RepID=A0ABT7NG30_9BURK|nr:amidase [Variovorax dokdonensis]MDM0046909.1 amidase [Variovorax dokdonensis]
MSSTEFPLWQMNADALVQAYARGDLSPVEVLLSVRSRQQQCGSLLGAVLIAQDDAAADAQARASEARWRRGTPLSALDGVPVSVKDNIAQHGLPCRWGSRAFSDHWPTHDEQPVARLRNAGAVLLGKTNVPEFTLQGYTDNALFGPTRNPWNRALTPGGSSGGAVAAVASGIGPLALATDGGGSIRRPCAYTGLFGFKPGRGVVPRADGLPALLPGLEEIGPIARNIADLARILLVIAPEMSGSLLPTPLPSAPLRIAYWRSIGTSPVDPVIRDRVDEAAEQLRDLGHVVVAQPAPVEVEQFNTRAWPVISGAGLAAVMATLPPGADAGLGAALAHLLAAGRSLSAVDLHRAQGVQRALTEAMAQVFSTHDLVLSPACAAMPWSAERSHPERIDGQAVDGRGHAVFTAFANGAGLPALALPCRPGDDGLPIGMQVVGPRGSDALLLGLGAQWEREAAPVWRWPELIEEAAV